MRFVRVLAALAFVLLSSATVSAHPLVTGEGVGSAAFWEGLMHPWLGWDHWLAMFTLGWWAFRLGSTARVWLPACFVAGMSLGCFAGSEHILRVFSDGFWEALIAVSILVLGGLLWLDRPVGLPVAVGLALVAGFTHGHVHGTEAGGLFGLRFTLGVLLATATLHGLGLLVGYCLAQRRSAVAVARWYGLGVGLVGLCLLLTMW